MNNFIPLRKLAELENCPFSFEDLKTFCDEKETNGLTKIVKNIGSAIFVNAPLFDKWLNDQFKEEEEEEETPRAKSSDLLEGPEKVKLSKPQANVTKASHQSTELDEEEEVEEEDTADMDEGTHRLTITLPTRLLDEIDMRRKRVRGVYMSRNLCIIQLLEAGLPLVRKRT
jgi:hypothetical protein